MSESPVKPATALPPMEAVLEIDVVGEDDGQHYRGEFTYRRPTLRDKAKIAIDFAKLKKDAENLNDDVSLLLFMSSHLKTTIVEAPKWFIDSNGGLDLYSANILTEIYVKTVAFENEWHKKVFPEQANDKKPE